LNTDPVNIPEKRLGNNIDMTLPAISVLGVGCHWSKFIHGVCETTLFMAGKAYKFTPFFIHKIMGQKRG
jgi:hypothetical protein